MNLILVLALGTCSSQAWAAETPSDLAIKAAQEERLFRSKTEAMKKIIQGLGQQNRDAQKFYKTTEGTLRTNAEVLREYPGTGGPGFQPQFQGVPGVAALDGISAIGAATGPTAVPGGEVGAKPITIATSAIADLTPETDYFQLSQALRKNPALREKVRARLLIKIKEQKTKAGGGDKEELAGLAAIDRAIKDSEDLAPPGKLNGITAMDPNDILASIDPNAADRQVAALRNDTESLFFRVKTTYRHSEERGLLR